MNPLVDSESKKFEVWLFATDIVNFVFLKSSTLPSEVVTGHFPGFVCKDFSDTLKRAVEIIRNTLRKDIEEDFARFQQRGEVNPDEYTKYAKGLGMSNSRGGFKAENYLYYCVNLALMAYRFYQGGVRRAQISAVFCVAEGLQDYGSCYHLWEVFNEIAQKIVGGVAGGPNIVTNRSHPRETCIKGNDDFTTPDICCKDRQTASVARARTNPDVGKVFPSKHYSSADLAIARPFNRGILVNTCSGMNYRKKIYQAKGSNATSCLHVSFESSVEQISMSSALSFLKNEHASNSTPTESSVRWKAGDSKRTPRGNSFLKQIFKLSPINRIKAESFGFK